MDANVLAYVVGAVVILVLASTMITAVESRRTRRMVEAFFGQAGRDGLLSSVRYERAPVIIGHTPGSSRPPSGRPVAGGPASSDGPPSTVGRPKRERLAPGADAPEPAVRDERELVRPPPIARDEPELRQDRPVETERKPGSAPSSRQRPAVTAESDRSALVRALDDSDQAQAEEAPQPSQGFAPLHAADAEVEAASGTHGAGAPPVSGPVAPDASLRAAGLQRPLAGREIRSEAPPPHKPPVKSVRPSLLGGVTGGTPTERPPRAAARAATPTPTRARAPSQPVTSDVPVPVALLSAAPVGLGGDDEATFKHPGKAPFSGVRSEDFDDEEEQTRVADRPNAEALAPKPGIRASHATLPSMPSVVPASARLVATVETVSAGAPPVVTRVARLPHLARRDDGAGTMGDESQYSG
jgi:hypothetical protein